MSMNRSIFLLLAGAALAAATPLAEARADAEFRRVDGQLRCLDESGGEVYPPGMDCLRIGPVRIGETLRSVAMKFGKERQKASRGAVTERVYPIDVGAQPGQRVPYWVIGFEEQRVVSIQITGEVRVEQYDFSSIRVGDPEVSVLNRMGVAGFNQPAPHINGQLWGYPPYPVTFEIKDGKVYSMRVSEAIGK